MREHVVTWADATQAVSTSLAAGLTVAALAVTIFIARREHHAARDALTEQHQLLREQAAREHLIDLVLKIQDEIAVAIANVGSAEGSAAKAKLIGLLAAVPDPYLLRNKLRFGPRDPGIREQLSRDLQATGVDTSQAGWDSTDALSLELAAYLREVSGARITP